jgi:hypothetical protein
VNPPNKAAIQIGGSRLHQKVFVLIQGHPVSLSIALFNTFLDLVCALLSGDEYTAIPSGNGDPEYSRILVYRLRRVIDHALEPGSGKRLVQTGIGSEYKLNVLPSDLAIDASFFSLPKGTVDPATREFLLSYQTEILRRQSEAGGVSGQAVERIDRPKLDPNPPIPPPTAPGRSLRRST